MADFGRRISGVALSVGSFVLFGCGAGADGGQVSAGAPPPSCSSGTGTGGYEVAEDALPAGYGAHDGLRDNGGLEVAPTTARTFRHPDRPGAFVTVVEGDSDALEAIVPADGGRATSVQGHRVVAFDADDERNVATLGVRAQGDGLWDLVLIGTAGPAASLVPFVDAAVDDHVLGLGEPVASGDLNPYLGLRRSTYTRYTDETDQRPEIVVQYVAGAAPLDPGVRLGTMSRTLDISGCRAVQAEHGATGSVTWSDGSGLVILTGPTGVDLVDVAESVTVVTP